jgi:broad specificity phosphatase PhoE
MDIYLLRHAESNANKMGFLSSENNDQLTDKGIEQSNQIINELCCLNIDHILCSPLQRAINTVNPYSCEAGLNIEIVPCLAEGQLILDERVEVENPIYIKSKNGYKQPIEKETKNQFLGRVAEAAKVIKSKSIPRLLVVTHGHMIRELINNLLGLRERVRFPHDNCGLSCISNASDSGLHSVKYINRNISSNKTNAHGKI